MPSLESACQRIFEDPDIKEKLLKGGLLSFVPVVNLLAFGYIYRFAASVRRGGTYRLPEWEDWAGLFADGVRLFIISLIFGGIPILAGAIASSILFWFFSLLQLKFLAFTLGLIPASVGFAVAVPLTLSALFVFQKDEDWSSLGELSRIIGLLRLTWEALLIPLLAFWGLQALGLPLWGFAQFIGWVCLAAYVYSTFLFALNQKTYSQPAD